MSPCRQPRSVFLRGAGRPVGGVSLYPSSGESAPRESSQGPRRRLLPAATSLAVPPLILPAKLCASKRCGRSHLRTVECQPVTSPLPHASGRSSGGDLLQQASILGAHRLPDGYRTRSVSLTRHVTVPLTGWG